MLNYKSIKNQDKPGRPPRGCIWAKDEEGQRIFNDQGEIAYREATQEEMEAKTAEKEAKVAKKQSKGAESTLTLKGTYSTLSYTALEKVISIATDLMADRKNQERSRLEQELSDIQSKLGAL